MRGFCLTSLKNLATQPIDRRIALYYNGYTDGTQGAKQNTRICKMYTINRSKLEAITAIINDKTEPSVTEEIIEAHITADWHEGDEHQAWIDSASVEEIADWVVATAYPV